MCLHLQTERKAFLKKIKRNLANFTEANKINHSMMKSNSECPRLSGSIGELNPLMNYNTPLTIIT